MKELSWQIFLWNPYLDKCSCCLNSISTLVCYRCVNRKGEATLLAYIIPRRLHGFEIWSHSYLCLGLINKAIKSASINAISPTYQSYPLVLATDQDNIFIAFYSTRLALSLNFNYRNSNTNNSAHSPDLGWYPGWHRTWIMDPYISVMVFLLHWAAANNDYGSTK